MFEEKLCKAIQASVPNGSPIGIVAGPGSDPVIMQAVLCRLLDEPVTVRTQHQHDGSTDSRPELVLLPSRPYASEFDVVDPFDAIEDAVDLFTLAGSSIGANPEGVALLAPQFAPALGILKELRELLQRDITSGQDRTGLLDAARRSVTFETCLREAMAMGRQTFDIARVMYLIEPESIDLSDEWAELASSLSGTPVTCASLSKAFVAAPEYFRVDHKGDVPCVHFRTPFTRTLLLGLVPLSQSEHLNLYRRLRKRGLESLTYSGDASDDFVRRQLPVQAARGGALAELLADPAAVLSSDVISLARQVEHFPDMCRSAHGRIFLQTAHHLSLGRDRASHLELSAIRVGELTYAAGISQILANSPWRGVWNRAEPVNVNRVVAVCRSPVLSVRAVRDDPQSRFIASCSDGKLWIGHAYGDASVVFDGSLDVGEIRSCDAVVSEHGWLAAAVSSDQKVLCVQGDPPRVRWIDQDAHTAPLSCVAIGGDLSSPLIASSGVDGSLRVWDANGAAHAGNFYHRHKRSGLSVEIRGVQFVGDGALAFCAGDGFVGLVDVASGDLISEHQLGIGVLNAIRVSEGASGLHILVGSSTGVVAMATWSKAGNSWGAVREVARHLGSVNDVTFIPGQRGPEVLSASSDRTWRISSTASVPTAGAPGLDGPLPADPVDPIRGHFGAVWSITSVKTSNGDMVVTAGSEGLCRLWVSEAVRNDSLVVERASRHIGPVNSIRIRRVGDRDATIYTGGADAKVRRWHLGGSAISRPLAHAPSGITTLATSRAERESRDEVVAATDHGAILYFELKGTEAPPPITLGIDPNSINALCIMNVDGKQLLFTGADDGRTSTWNLDRITHRTPANRMNALHDGSITSICTGRDAEGNPIIIVATQDGVLSFRRVPSLDEFFHLRLPTQITCVAELPAYEHGWIAGLIDGTVAFRTNVVGRSSFEAHRGDVTRVASTVLGGRTVAVTAGLDRYVRVWDLPTLRCIGEIELDGIPLDLQVISNLIALATTSGASMFELRDMATLVPADVGRPRP